MNRRDFFKTGVLAGTFFGLNLLLNNKSGNLFAAGENVLPDLAAIKGGRPEDMFDKGIEALGGMKNFVKPGQTVLLKPNMSWAQPPEIPSNTNPALIKRIAEHCLKAGAKKVYFMDYILNRNSETISGVKAAALAGGAEFAPSDAVKYYTDAVIPGARQLKRAKVHELIAEADVFINVPVLKNHGSTELSAALKNLMGVVWDRGYYHRNDLNQCIADFALFRKPTLNVVDAYRVIVTGGPRGNSASQIIQPEMQFISADIVAVDAVAAAQAKKWGVVRGDVPYIAMAHDLKLGNMNLNELKIRKINL